VDIICPRCDEPCDMSELHEFAPLSYDEARRIFFDTSQGCGQLFNDRPCERVESLRADVSAAMADLLGDDVDGIAAMMDDFDYIGAFD